MHMNYNEAREEAVKVFKKETRDIRFPEEWNDIVTLGGYDQGDLFVFELYIPGEKPENAIVLAKVEIGKKDKRANFILLYNQ